LGILDAGSSAPARVALLGLLGILAGQQVVPIAKQVIVREPINMGRLKTQCVPHEELPTKAVSSQKQQASFECEC
jgi:xanthosine utilization system XapX-like protein